MGRFVRFERFADGKSFHARIFLPHRQLTKTLQHIDIQSLIIGTALAILHLSMTNDMVKKGYAHDE